MKTLTLANGKKMNVSTERGGRREQVIRDKTKFTRKVKHKEKYV